MPLRLKSLELHGYKTFASRTVFEFADGITAIVGPNGSGKSNFADSLRWVLGEQSHNLLRAKKTEDMIFSGSEKRARSGMASVTITFDNTTGWLPVDFTEVAVTRRAHRDGHNEYLLNNQPVRLKDINELLARSGLSERTYTILGQGMVDASLALKADDRRKLFEEAAGIGLYRSRREESLKRLETTKRNLERVLDILAELDPRLRSLERQAKRAEDHRLLQEELKLILREWYGYHWHEYQRNLIDSQNLIKSHEESLIEARTSFTDMTRHFNLAREELLRRREEVNEWNKQISTLSLDRESMRREIAVLEERQRAVVEADQRSDAEQQRLRDELTLAEERLTEARKEIELVELETNEAKKQEMDAKAALDALNIERATIQQKIDAERKQLNELNDRRARHQAHLNELKNRIASHQDRLKNADIVIATAESTFTAAEKAYNEIKTELSAKEEKAQTLEESVAEMRKQVSDLDGQKRELVEQKHQLIADQTKLIANLEVLEQAEKELVGFASGAKFLLDAVKNDRVKGARGLLSAGLEVPKEYEVAVAAVLGDIFDSVVLDSDSAVDQALSLLENANERAVFLSANADHKTAKRSATNGTEVLGSLPELIKAQAGLQAVIERLFGNTLIVKDRAAAKKLRSSDPDSMIVTLLGEVFRADGVILAGKVNKASALGRPREKREVAEKLEVISKKADEVNARIEEINQVTSRLRSEIDRKDRELRETQKELKGLRAEENKRNLSKENSQRQVDFHKRELEQLSKDIKESEADQTETEYLLEDVEEKLSASHEVLRQHNGNMAGLSIDETSSNLSLWQARVSVSNKTLSDANQRARERENAIQSIQHRIHTAEEQRNSYKTSAVEMSAEESSLQAKENDLIAKLEAIRALVVPGEEALTAAEKKENDLQGKELDTQRNLTSVERTHSQLQIDLSRKEEALESLKRRIEEDFGLVQFDYEQSITGEVPLPMGDLVETLPLVTTLSPDLEQALTAKRGQIKRMGAINPDAKNEYESVKERHRFMTEQVEDLNKAEEDLREVIRELDELTKKEFTKTFEQVAEEFKKIFSRLFGGGSARLTLTDPDNLTETGIDIEAKLPGRREQGLSLLSGGERSLTAISLVFALLRVSPTPLCVMDEVDAMLDEANVGRFRDLLGELGKTTQFIVVTHNRNTVQVADVIYGITMGKDSASQQISLKLDEISDEMLGTQQ